MHRRLEDRPGQHETIEQSHGEAGGRTGGERAEQPARRRAVDEYGVAVARVGDRDDIGTTLLVVHRDVCDPPRVKHRVEGGSVVELFLGQSPDGGAAYSRVHASVSTARRICSISSKCDWSQMSGGASWMTGSPRSSARQ